MPSGRASKLRNIRAMIGAAAVWLGLAVAASAADIMIGDQSLTFEPFPGYCMLDDQGGGKDAEFFEAMRQASEPTRQLLWMFADCKERDQWLSDPAAGVQRYGAVLAHKPDGDVRAHGIPRGQYLSKLEKAFSSDPKPDELQIKEALFAALGNIKPTRSQILYKTNQAIFVGIVADLKIANGETRKMAGVIAATLVRQLPISVHFYRSFKSDDTVGALFPEAMTTIEQMLKQERDNSPEAELVRRQGEAEEAQKRAAEEAARRAAAAGPGLPLDDLKSSENAVRQRIIAALRAGEFNKLDRQFAAAQSAYEEGKLAELPLLNSYLAFGAADPSLAEHFDAWIAAEPNSFVPRLARGIYNFRLGWVSRGSGWTEKIASERLALATRYFDLAKKDLAIAVTMRPQLGIAWGLQLAMAMASGNAPLGIYRTGIKQAPASLYLRRIYVESLDPDAWGPDLYAPKWLPSKILRYLVGSIRSAMLMKDFLEVTDQDAWDIVPLRKVVNTPLYGQARDQLFTREGYGARHRLVLALRDDPKSAAYILAGEASMAREAYPRAVVEFNAALQMGDMWQETVLNRAEALRHHGWRMRDFSSYAAALRDVRSLLAADSHDPRLLLTASRLLSEMASLFPEREQELVEPWGALGCRPELMKPQPFKFTHMATPQPDKTDVYCTIEGLLARAMMFGEFEYEVRAMRGSLYFYSLRLPRLAADEYKKAVEIYPDGAQAWGAYYRVLVEVDDCAGAKAAFQRYTELCSEQGCPTHQLEASRLEFSQFSARDQCS